MSVSPPGCLRRSVSLFPDAPMNVRFTCPDCQRSTTQELSQASAALACQHCARELRVPEDAFDESGRLGRCLVCPSRELFVRKDFPQRLGVAIVTVGLLASCVAWAYSQLYLTFGILLATALVDLVLYLVVPNALMCYRCAAEYRRADGTAEHGSFDLSTYERHRQQVARMAKLSR
jgi:hypothetical protein